MTKTATPTPGQTAARACAESHAASPPPAVEPVALPEGWKLVPVEPTDAMIDAGDEINEAGAAWSGYAEIPASAEKHYRAMLAAAPTPPASTDLREVNERLEAERAEQWRLRREMEASRDMERALAATLSAENAALKERLERAWLPIEKADREITHQQTFPEIGLTLQNSDRYWVRDADGRVFEASWTEDGKGRDYWWDWEGESPVDPVEFMPHPLAALAREGK